MGGGPAWWGAPHDACEDLRGRVREVGCPSAGTLHAAGDFFSLTGAVRACGDTPLRPGTLRACGGGNPVPDGVECPRPGRHAPRRAGCPRLRGSVPAWGDTQSVVRPRRRGTSLWTVSPRIEDVPFDRGLRSPTEGDGPGAVVWGRSTSWAQNAVPDGPGRPCGAVVGTDQGRSGTAATTSWWLPPPAAEPASTARTGRHDFPGASPPQGRVLAAHDGLACRSRGTPA